MEIVPLLQVRVYNMYRVNCADITGGVEPQLLPGCPPAGYHGTVVGREVHLQGSSAVQCSAKQCNVVQCSAVPCRAVQCTRTPQKHKYPKTHKYTSTEKHKYGKKHKYTKTQEQKYTIGSLF